MPLPREHRCTSEDYWSLPEGRRAELIGGQLYDMAPPSRTHQKLIMELSSTIRNFIKEHNGSCEVYPAPFAVNIDAEDKDWVEPDISVICDPSKLDDRGCNGAPDWVIEIVSPGSKRMDYFIKLFKYQTAGVKEYWIVDPDKNRVMVYLYEKDEINVYDFADEIPVGIYDGDLKIKIE